MIQPTWGSGVLPPMMPSGVEHRGMSNALGDGLEGVTTYDADRRCSH